MFREVDNVSFALYFGTLDVSSRATASLTSYHGTKHRDVLGGPTLEASEGTFSGGRRRVRVVSLGDGVCRYHANRKKY